MHVNKKIAYLIAAYCVIEESALKALVYLPGSNQAAFFCMNLYRL